jgi:hypothetical protein
MAAASGQPGKADYDSGRLRQWATASATTDPSQTVEGATRFSGADIALFIFVGRRQATGIPTCLPGRLQKDFVSVRMCHSHAQNR